jgi:hypothetical protein
VTITENSCGNALQCWLNQINYGVRAGGGMGDAMPHISYVENSSLFAKVLFFNMTFQIIIVLVLGNIFLGIIVDAFTDLRDLKNLFENDLNNICFICQLTRSKSSSKAIDFDEHITTKHSIWNYVDFIIYLYVNNPNDFNQYELEAYNSLQSHEMAWMPIDEDSL